MMCRRTAFAFAARSAGARAGLVMLKVKSPARARSLRGRLPTILSVPLRRASSGRDLCGAPRLFRCVAPTGMATLGAVANLVSSFEFPMHLLLFLLVASWAADGKEDAAMQDLAK